MSKIEGGRDLACNFFALRPPFLSSKVSKVQIMAGVTVIDKAQGRHGTPNMRKRFCSPNMRKRVCSRMQILHMRAGTESAGKAAQLSSGT